MPGTPIAADKAFQAQLAGLEAQIANINALLRTLATLFVQLAGKTEAFIAWGAISEAGGVPYGSENYTVTKTNTGEYEVKWNTEKPSANYTVLVSPGPISSAGNVAVVFVSERTVKGFRVRTFNIKEVQLNMPWNFATLSSM